MSDPIKAIPVFQTAGDYLLNDLVPLWLQHCKSHSPSSSKYRFMIVVCAGLVSSPTILSTWTLGSGYKTHCQPLQAPQSLCCWSWQSSVTSGRKTQTCALFQRVYEHCFFIHVDIQNINLDQIMNLFKLTKFWPQKKFLVLKYTFRLYFIGRLSFLYIGHALD